MLRTLWQFGRPHTLIGSTLSVLALYALAARGYAPDAALVGWSLLAALACNVYITGLNQWADVAVDRVNKPWLPIPAGRLSRRNAGVVIVVCLLVALGTSAWLSWPFFGLIALIAAIGTAYSLPPLHLKRHHGLAAGAIALVRGLLINVGFYLHFLHELGAPPVLATAIWPLVGFVAAFSLGIAWFKDIPDTAGDAQYHFGTLAVRWGRGHAFRAGVWVVSLAYAGVIAAAWAGSLPNPRWFMVSHAALWGLFLTMAFRLDVGDDRAVKRFYMLFWGLFFVEYGVYVWGFWM